MRIDAVIGRAVLRVLVGEKEALPSLTSAVAHLRLGQTIAIPSRRLPGAPAVDVAVGVQGALAAPDQDREKVAAGNVAGRVRRYGCIRCCKPENNF